MAPDITETNNYNAGTGNSPMQINEEMVFVVNKRFQKHTC